MPDQGDIVLVPVPFTDLTSHKRRPVVVVSNNTYNRSCADVIVVAMTSNLAPSPSSFVITSADLIEGTLNRPSRIRSDKIYTLAQAIVVKKFGKVAPAIIQRIRQMLDSITEP